MEDYAPTVLPALHVFSAGSACAEIAEESFATWMKIQE